MVEKIVPDQSTSSRVPEPVPSSDQRQRGNTKGTPASAKAAVRVIKKKKTEVKTAQMIETAIADAERKLSEISQQMSLPEVARNPEQLIKLDHDYRDTENRLKVLYEEWETTVAQNLS